MSRRAALVVLALAAPACKDWEQFSEPAPWWDAAWPKRRELTVENTSDRAWPAGTPIAWRLDYADVLDPETALHVMRWDGTWHEVAFDVDDDTPGLETIWFALDREIPRRTGEPGYFVYFGADDPAPADPSIFELDETFEDAAMPSGWDAAGAVSVGPGTHLELGAGGVVRSTAPVARGTALDVLVAVDAETPGLEVGFAGADEAPAIVWRAESTTFQRALREPEGTELIGDPTPLGTNRAHRLTIERRLSGRVCFRFDAADCVLSSVISPDDALPLRFVYTGASAATILEARTRAALEHEPAIDVGDEEVP